MEPVTLLCYNYIASFLPNHNGEWSFFFPLKGTKRQWHGLRAPWPKYILLDYRKFLVWFFQSWGSSIFKTCMYICVHVCLMHGYPREIGRGRWSSLELELQVTNSMMWVLGIELASSGRAISTRNHRAISPAPEGGFLKLYHLHIWDAQTCICILKGEGHNNKNHHYYLRDPGITSFRIVLSIIGIHTFLPSQLGSDKLCPQMFTAIASRPAWSGSIQIRVPRA